MFFSAHIIIYLKAKTMNKKNYVSVYSRCTVKFSPVSVSLVRSCLGNATDRFVFPLMYLPFAYIHLIVYGFADRDF